MLHGLPRAQNPSGGPPALPCGEPPAGAPAVPGGEPPLGFGVPAVPGLPPATPVSPPPPGARSASRLIPPQEAVPRPKQAQAINTATRLKPHMSRWHCNQCARHCTGTLPVAQILLGVDRAAGEGSGLFRTAALARQACLLSGSGDGDSGANAEAGAPQDCTPSATSLAPSDGLIADFTDPDGGFEIMAEILSFHSTAARACRPTRSLTARCTSPRTPRQRRFPSMSARSCIQRLRRRRIGRPKRCARSAGLMKLPTAAGRESLMGRAGRVV
jgi:hypothetical protein